MFKRRSTSILKPPFSFKRLSAWEQFRIDLLLYFCTPAPGAPTSTSDAQGTADATTKRAEPIPGDKRIRIVCISDTHNSRPPIPDGDILLHGGDLTNNGTFDELQAQLNWLATLPHPHKFVIAGNHDMVLDPKYIASHIHFDPGGKREDLDWHDITYLENASITVHLPDLGRSLNIYGCPTTPACGSWAFQHFKRYNIWESTIPAGTDILLTHGPPKGHLDDGDKGCPHLLAEIRRARPPMVVFGHIHEARGTEVLDHDDWDTYARDAVNTVDRAPGIFRVLALIAALLVHRALRLLGLGLGSNAKTRKTSQLVNAASMGRFGLRETEEERAGTVVYL